MEQVENNVNSSGKIKLLEKLVVQFYDYSVFLQDAEGKLKETFFTNREIHWDIIPRVFENPDDYINYVREVAKKESLADVIFATVYSYVVTEQGYEDMKKLFPKSTDKEIQLRIFKNLFFSSNNVKVKAAFPVVIRDFSKKVVLN